MKLHSIVLQVQVLSVDVKEEELVIERQVEVVFIVLVLLSLSAVSTAALSLGNSSLTLGLHCLDSPGVSSQGRPV